MVKNIFASVVFALGCLLEKKKKKKRKMEKSWILIIHVWCILSVFKPGKACLSIK